MADYSRITFLDWRWMSIANESMAFFNPPFVVVMWLSPLKSSTTSDWVPCTTFARVDPWGMAEGKRQICVGFAFLAQCACNHGRVDVILFYVSLVLCNPGCKLYCMLLVPPPLNEFKWRALHEYHMPEKMFVWRNKCVHPLLIVKKVEGSYSLMRLGRRQTHLQPV